MSTNKAKNQHYVPRVVLKGFSPDARSVSAFVLKSRRLVSRASIGDQCAKHLFYGEDGVIEKALGEIEGELGAVLGDRSRSKLAAMSAAEALVVSLYMLIQRNRTVAAGHLVNAVHDGIAKRIVAKDSRLRQSGVDLSGVRFGYDAPHLLALQNAAICAPLFLDMELKVLITDKKPGFVLSDDPVVLFNQYAERSPELESMTTIGWAHKGLQVFLPISGTACLALFDPMTYEYGSRKSRICSPSVRDIKTLNVLQALNARQCLYFDPNQTPGDELARLADENKRHDGWREPTFLVSDPRERPGGGTSQILATRTPQVHLPFQFGFVRIIDVLPRGPNLPIRTPELVEAMMEERYRMFPEQKKAAEEIERELRRRSYLSEAPWTLRPDPTG